MFGTDLAPDLQYGGAALIYSFVTPDGEPVAGRAWGLREIGVGPPTVRVIIPGGQLRPELLGTGFAITGSNVLTLVSAQLKGRLVALDDYGDGDRPVFEQYREAFFLAVEEADHIPWASLERMVPVAFDVAIVEVSETYDQTPGPSAGELIWTLAAS